MQGSFRVWREGDRLYVQLNHASLARWPFKEFWRKITEEAREIGLVTKSATWTEFDVRNEKSYMAHDFDYDAWIRKHQD